MAPSRWRIARFGYLLLRRSWTSSARPWRPTRWPGNTHVPTQRLARVARDAALGGILYRSVRDLQLAWCLALLTPSGFAKARPEVERQTWFLAVSRKEMTLRRDTESMPFSVTRW